MSVVTVIFTPEDTETYSPKETTVVVKIRHGIPTGEPVWKDTFVYAVLKSDLPVR